MPVMTRTQMKNSINNVPIVNLVKNVIPIPESSKKNIFVSIDQAEINYIRSLPGFKNRVYVPGGVTLMKDCFGLLTRKCAKNISYKQFFDDEEIIINVCKPHFEQENGKVKVTFKWTKANANEIGDSEYIPEDEEQEDDDEDEEEVVIYRHGKKIYI
jgi:hypothetical protein